MQQLLLDLQQQKRDQLTHPPHQAQQQLSIQIMNMLLKQQGKKGQLEQWSRATMVLPQQGPGQGILESKQPQQQIIHIMALTKQGHGGTTLEPQQQQLQMMGSQHQQWVQWVTQPQKHQQLLKKELQQDMYKQIHQLHKSIKKLEQNQLDHAKDKNTEKMKPASKKNKKWWERSNVHKNSITIFQWWQQLQQSNQKKASKKIHEGVDIPDDSNDERSANYRVDYRWEENYVVKNSLVTVKYRKKERKR